MYKHTNFITSSQLFVTLFVSQLIIHLSYNPILSGSDNMWAHIISCLVSLVLTFIICIPILKLQKKFPKENIFSLISYRSKLLKKILCSIYAVYFLITSCLTIAVLNIFISNVIDPKIPIVTLVALIVLVAIYGAYKGIEGLVRASSIIFLFMLLALLVFMFAIGQRLNMLNYTLLFQVKTHQVLSGSYILLSRLTSLPVLAILYPIVKGNFKKSFSIWVVALYLTVAFVIFLLVGSIGEYIKTHIFPVYAATGIIEAGIFQRLDSLYLSAFVMGVFVRISLFLYLFSYSMQKVFTKLSRNVFLWLGGMTIFFISISFSNFDQLHFISSTFLVLFFFTLMVGCFIPLGVLLMKKFKRENIFKLSIMIIPLIVLCGCSHGVPLNERLLIQGIGVDKVDDLYILTVDVFDSEKVNASEESSGNNTKMKVITLRGKSIYDAFTKITKITGKDPLCSQNLVLVIGEESAKNGINSFIDFFIRYYESRPAIDVFIAKGKASDIFNAKFEGENITAKTLSELAKTTYLNLLPSRSNLVEFIGDMHSIGTDAYALTIETTNSDTSSGTQNVILSGIGVFKGDQLVGCLDNDVAQGSSFIMQRPTHGGCLVLDIDNIGKVTYNIEKVKKSVKVKFDEEAATFDINVKVDANIYEIDRDIKEKIDVSSFKVLSEHLSIKIKTLIEQAIEKSLCEYGSDIFFFGKYLLREDKKVLDMSSDNFLKFLQGSKYNVHVDTKIKKIGQEANPI